MAKKTFLEKIAVGEPKQEIKPLNIPKGRFSFFKELFAKLGKLSQINMLAVLFAIPAIIELLWFYASKTSSDRYINYSGNIGVGHTVVKDAVLNGNVISYAITIEQFLYFIPLLMLAFVGLAGAFYAVRQLAQGDVKVKTAFFIGIKRNFFNFIMFGLIAGLAVFLFMFCLHFFDAAQLGIGYKIASLIVSGIILLFTAALIMYSCTQETFYKIRLSGIFKNGFLFAFRLPIQSIIFSALGVAPIILLAFVFPFAFSSVMLTSLIGIFVVTLFLLLGITLIICIWTVYTDYVYELAFEAQNTKTQKQGKNNSAKKQSKA